LAGETVLGQSFDVEDAMKRSVWLGLAILLALLAMGSVAGCGSDTGDNKYVKVEGLYRCKDCGEVLDWLRESAILRMEREVEANQGMTPGDDDWGDDDEVITDDDAMDDDVADDDAFDDDGSAGDDDQSGDENGDDDEHSDTNVQEQGVDEADMVKTDGDYLYLVTGGYLIIYRVDPVPATTEVSRVDIEGAVSDMFLYDDLAVVFSYLESYALPDDVWPGVSRDELYYQISKVTLVDVADKAHPQVIRELYFEGELVSSRRVDASVRIVLNTAKNGPAVQTWLDDWEYPTQEELDAAYAELIQQNIDLINNAPLEAWMPRYAEVNYAAGGAVRNEGLLNNCEDVYRPENPLGDSVLSVVTILLTEPLEKQTDIAVLADGSVVYASQSHLFVTGSYETEASWLDESQLVEEQSQIHVFDIAADPGEAIYLASGEVRGWVLNQFSMSEFDGRLRVATSYGGWWNGTPERNGVYVFAVGDSSLPLVGQLEDIALNEQLQSARFLGSRGFLVTYLNTDPLFTVDLSDPEQPALVGQLEVPGFSTYLHPMDADHLLAIGVGGNDWGANGSVALSLFDVSDFAHPERTDYVEVGDWGATSEAQYNHHAFLYYPDDNLLAIPLQVYDYSADDDTWIDDDTWSDDDIAPDDDASSGPPDASDGAWPGSGAASTGTFSGFYVYYVTPESGFDLQAQIDHAGFTGEQGGDVYYGTSTPRRSVVIGNYLFTISDLGLIATRIGSWENAFEDNLPYEDPWSDWYDDDSWEGGGPGGGSVPPDEP
jgi:hypothetical protein